MAANVSVDVPVDVSVDVSVDVPVADSVSVSVLRSVQGILGGIVQRRRVQTLVASLVFQSGVIRRRRLLRVDGRPRAAAG